MTNKFQFRFKALWELRRATRDERSASLAQALQAEGKLQGWMADLSQELQSLRQSRAHVGTLDTQRILATASFEGTLRATLHQCEQDLIQVQQEVEKRRQALTIADQAARVLEKLRDKLEQQHQHELLRQETKFLDEVTTSQTFRRQQSQSSET